MHSADSHQCPDTRTHTHHGALCYFNFCTEKEGEGKNDDISVHSDTIFALKLISADGG